MPFRDTGNSSKLNAADNPAGPNGWFNAFDPRDIVALNPLDGAFFPARPAITNFEKVDNKTDNRHGIVGYLNDPTVATEISLGLA